MRLSREACQSRCYLCGSLGGFGQLLQPLGEISFDDAYQSYREQVLAMTEAGINLVWILTMTDVVVMEAAAKVGRKGGRR